MDLEELFAVHSIMITKNCNCHGSLLQNVTVQISIVDPTNLATFPNQIDPESVCMIHEGPIPDIRPNIYSCNKTIIGRYVLLLRGEVEGGSQKQLRVCELDVYGNPSITNSTIATTGEHTDRPTAHGNIRRWSYSFVDGHVGNSHGYNAAIEGRRQMTLCARRHAHLTPKKKLSFQYMQVDLDSLSGDCQFLKKKEYAYISQIDRWVLYKMVTLVD